MCVVLQLNNFISLFTRHIFENLSCMQMEERIFMHVSFLSRTRTI